MNINATVASPAPADDCHGDGILFSPDQARDLILEGVSAVTGDEALPLGRASTRVLAADLLAQVALPRFDNAAVDGFGLHALDLQRPGPLSLSRLGEVRAGSALGAEIQSGEAVRVFTGARVPGSVAAIVPDEHVSLMEGTILVPTLPSTGANIRRQGEDVAPDVVIVPAGSLIDARHIAIAAAAGVGQIRVRRRVRVGLLSIGSELVENYHAVVNDLIIDSNRPMLAALIASPAVDLVDLGIAADGVAGLSNSLLDASGNLDLLITSGGVAGSEADPVAGAMSRLDAPFHPLKLALRPGKPIGYGRVGAMRVLALPGNPVAAMANLLLFGRPLMAALTGAAGQLPRGEAAVAAALFGHRPGRTELVPARITGTAADGRPLVGKLGRGGSARLLPLVAADGFACVPASVGDLPAGAPLLFYSFRNGFSL